MTKLVKFAIILGSVTAGAALTTASAQVRIPKAVIAPTTPARPVNLSEVRRLTPAELQARMQPPPRYFDKVALKAPIYANVTLSQIPDLVSPFSLTPAVQSVAGRGSMSIAAEVNVPNPLPPGFPGQATLRYHFFGLGAGGGYLGTVALTINAQKSVFYAIDCLAAINPKQAKIEYSISGADSNQTGSASVVNGHVAFIVRRSASDGNILITFHPPQLEQVKTLTGTMSDVNVMDFWGCQISSGT